VGVHGEAEPAGGDVPEVEHPFRPRADDGGAVGGEVDGVDRVPGVAQHGQFAAVRRVPQADDLVVAGGGDAASRAIEGDVVDRLGVPGHGRARRAVGGAPQPGDPVPPAGDEPRSVGRGGDAPGLRGVRGDVRDDEMRCRVEDAQPAVDAGDGDEPSRPGGAQPAGGQRQARDHRAAGRVEQPQLRSAAGRGDEPSVGGEGGRHRALRGGRHSCRPSATFHAVTHPPASVTASRVPSGEKARPRPGSCVSRVRSTPRQRRCSVA
jgi:hypothetical protein